MGWLENLQSAPKEKKIKVIWITLGICLVIMIGLWILVGNYSPNIKSDNSFFEAISSSVKNFSKQYNKPK